MKKIPRKLPGVQPRERDLKTRVDQAKFVVGTSFRNKDITQNTILSVYHLAKIYRVDDVARATGYSVSLVRKMIQIAATYLYKRAD